MLLKRITLLVLTAIFSSSLIAGTGNALLGWQTFETTTPGSPNTGIDDTTPDTNSTFDSTPVGGISASGHYLTGAIGPNASGQGRNGFGENTNNTFMNGPNFGGNDLGNAAGEDIVDWPLADGTPGMRIGPQLGAGTSSWKFANSANQRLGDFSITNHSDYFFRLEHIHFDARIGNSNSPHDFDIIYLATPGELLKGSDDTELVNLVPIFNTQTVFDFGTAPDTINVSRSIGAAISDSAYLAPGQSASFRIRWTNQLNDTAESQLDNLAFEGTFFETADFLNIVDPVAVEGVEENVPVVPVVFQLFLVLGLGIIGVRSLAKRS